MLAAFPASDAGAAQRLRWKANDARQIGVLFQQRDQGGRPATNKFRLSGKWSLSSRSTGNA